MDQKRYIRGNPRTLKQRPKLQQLSESEYDVAICAVDVLAHAVSYAVICRWRLATFEDVGLSGIINDGKALSMQDSSLNNSPTPLVCKDTAGLLHEATRKAEELAVYLWEKHYKADAPQWQPRSGHLMDLLWQIDNMITGLTRPTPMPIGGE